MAGIYIHIPFCKKACHYCDFHFSTSLKQKENLLVALKKELSIRKKELQSKVVKTIYIGGGTPSILSVDELQSLLHTVFAHYNVVRNPEITLEANPDDLNSEKLKKLAKTAVNRFSIGVQSFFDDDLKFMNRSHNACQAEDAVKRTFDSGFLNCTIDLIYGIPMMSSDKWEQNLYRAFELEVPHLSCYALTVEKKTALYDFIKKNRCPPVDEALSSEHFNILMAKTGEHDFVHYEISNFSKPGFFSNHNIAYWAGDTYLGIGPSAHSFDGMTRSWNIANTIAYIKAMSQNKCPSTTEQLTTDDRYNEYIMTGLRTLWGISLRKISKTHGESYLKNTLIRAEKSLNCGLLKQHGDTIKATKKGKFLIDGIAADFFMV